MTPIPVADLPPRPRFEGGRDFALWALNAPDLEVPLDGKLRCALALLGADARAPAKKPAPPADDGVWAALIGRHVGPASDEQGGEA